MDTAIVQTETESDYHDLVVRGNISAHDTDEHMAVCHGVTCAATLVDGRVRIEFDGDIPAATVGQEGADTPSAEIVQVH